MFTKLFTKNYKIILTLFLFLLIGCNKNNYETSYANFKCTDLGTLSILEAESLMAQVSLLGLQKDKLIPVDKYNLSSEDKAALKYTERYLRNNYSLQKNQFFGIDIYKENETSGPGWMIISEFNGINFEHTIMRVTNFEK